MPAASIHEACRRGDVDAVRALIAADPAIVDVDDEHGWRPIFHAGLWRREPVVRLLLEAGADLAAHDGYVLHYAGEVPGNKAIVSLLVQYGALDAHVRPTDDLSRQFLAAVFLADIARVGALLGRHPHLATAPDGRGDQPIHHAARNGDTEVVRLLIAHGADVNAQNARPHRLVLCRGARPSRYPAVASQRACRLRRQVYTRWQDIDGLARTVSWRLPLHANRRSITATLGRSGTGHCIGSWQARLIPDRREHQPRPPAR